MFAIKAEQTFRLMGSKSFDLRRLYLECGGRHGRPAAKSGSHADVHEPPAKIVAVRRPDAPPRPATGSAVICGLRGNRDPDGHERRRHRPPRTPTPAPTAPPAPTAAIPTAAAPASTPACAPPTPAAATPTPAMPAASPGSTVKATAIETVAMKAAAAMPLSLSRRGHRGHRRRHAKRSYGRNYDLLDRNTHGKILPLIGPYRRVLSLKLCHDGKSSRVSVRRRAKN